jgi:hypothetical protein
LTEPSGRGDGSGDDRRQDAPVPDRDADRAPLSLPIHAPPELGGPQSQGAAWTTPPPSGGDPLPLGETQPPPIPVTNGWGKIKSTARWVHDYFTLIDPGFWQAMLPLVVLSVVLFSRLPTTNYIFDEQEALLANPYVNGTQGLRYIDAIHRDFWGLPADRSVGSYRPIPNFLWRALWQVSKQPFFHHFYNVLFHAANGALLTVWTLALTRQRALAWMVGGLFVGCAVLTEAVSGIVGIADVLGGMGAILALVALRLPAWGMPFGVFAAVLFGLFCKESALVCVPLVPVAALVAASLTHPERPARFYRAALAFIGAATAFVLYVELRKRWFQSPLPAELSQPLAEDASLLKRVSHEFLVWFHQAPLPKDPLNNPLAEADTAHRIAGALRVYWRGLTQLVLPKTLSGDYSYPQEPIPDTVIFPESILGAAMTTLPLLAALVLWLVAWRREGRARTRASLIFGSYRDAPREVIAASSPPPEPVPPAVRLVGATLLGLSVGVAILDYAVFRRRGMSIGWRGIPLALLMLPSGLVGLGLFAEGGPRSRRQVPLGEPIPFGLVAPILLAIGMVWVVVSYFPHSNIPVVLPTVRAERFWYFPAIGSSMVLAVGFAWLLDTLRPAPLRWIPHVAFWLFLGVQGAQAYRHAMDYRDDVTFWEATKKAVPRSAKAHLNYSVMKGARGDLDTRLAESQIAVELAPKWPMAHVYTGDTLCRMHFADRAWPHYRRGFELGPNELSLIALALQCLYDEGRLTTYDAELRELAEKNPGSWIAYLAVDTLDNHDKHKGVDPKYRPRGYNEGPKDGE